MDSSFDKHTRPGGESDRTESATAGQHSASPGKVFIESVKSATLIALLMLIPIHYGIFSPVDQIIFSKISTLYTHLIEDKRHNATVVELDQLVYDELFDGSSPLPRTALGTLLKNLLAEPAAFIKPGDTPFKQPMVIDLDLSPRGKILDDFDKKIGTQEGSDCESLSDEFPVELALCSAKEKGIPVVLLAPFPTDDKAVAKKYRWMRFICDNAIADFAFGEIPDATATYALHYYANEKEKPQPKMLAHVAQRDTSGNALTHGLCADMHRHGATKDLPISFGFLDRSIAEAFMATDEGLSTLKSELYSDRAGTQLLNFSSHVVSISLSDLLCPDGKCSADKMKTLGAELARKSAGSPVFLGGTWDSSGADVFETPIGPTPGVYLHALAMVENPFLTEINHGIIAIVEIPIGVAMIYLFSFLWRSAGKHLQTIDDATPSLSHVGTIGYAALRYVLVLFTIAWTGILLALVALATATFLLSSFLWVTPSALLVSILLKTYMERNASHESQQNHHAINPYRSHVACLLEKLPLALMFVWAFYILKSHLVH